MANTVDQDGNAYHWQMMTCPHGMEPKYCGICLSSSVISQGDGLMQQITPRVSPVNDEIGPVQSWPGSDKWMEESLKRILEKSGGTANPYSVYTDPYDSKSYSEEEVIALLRKAIVEYALWDKEEKFSLPKWLEENLKK